MMFCYGRRSTVENLRRSAVIPCVGSADGPNCENAINDLIFPVRIGRFCCGGAEKHYSLTGIDLALIVGRGSDGRIPPR